MNYQQTILVLLGTLALIGCDPGKDSTKSAAVKNQPETTLANGFYAVLGEAKTKEKALAFQSEKVILYSYKYHQYSQGEDRDEPIYLAVNASPNVPLILADNPKTENDDEGSPLLRLQLDKTAAQDLEDFTGQHLGKTVAIIVGGEVISKHLVREALKGGQINITWCSANACETLRLKLTR